MNVAGHRNGIDHQPSRQRALRMVPAEASGTTPRYHPGVRNTMEGLGPEWKRSDLVIIIKITVIV